MSLFDDGSKIFTKEKALNEDWIPDNLPERSEEIQKLEMAFRPVANGADAKSALLIGKAGQGKTATTNFVLNQVRKYFENEEDENFTKLRVSCSDATTSYQVVGELLTMVEDGTTVRPKGRSLGHLNKRLFNELDDLGGYAVIVLDEIDHLASDDDILYEIPRARQQGRLEDAHASIVGMTNDFEFREKLSAKVKDSLADTVINFEPYDANDLRTILSQREEVAFVDDVLSEDVIPLCAARAAQDEGSARQAIKILYHAGELARSNGDTLVTEEHVREGIDRIEQEYVLNGLNGLTTQDQATLCALASLEKKGETPTRTKYVYSEYKKVAERIDINTLTSRSIRDKLQNLDTYSMAIASEKTGGSRGGPHYESELNVDLDALVTAFATIDRFQGVSQNLPIEDKQSTL